MRHYAARIMNVQTLSRRPEAPTEKRQAIEAAVLQAMEDLLGDGATYATLSVERIAKRAGISRTAFYFYFADKRELLMRLASKLSDELYREADAWWSGAGDGPEQLRDGARARSRRCTAPTGRSSARSSRCRRTTRSSGRSGTRSSGGSSTRARERIASEVAAGRAAARRRCPEATAFALVWMTERTLHQMLLQDGRVPDDELVRALERIWIATVYGG